jgi:hypothetical protein
VRRNLSSGRECGCTVVDRRDTAHPVLRPGWFRIDDVC